MLQDKQAEEEEKEEGQQAELNGPEMYTNQPSGCLAIHLANAARDPHSISRV